MNWDEVSEQLKAPLDPDAIKPPPQGKFGEYVDGLHVIREANRIFGHNGWSYKITRLEQVSRVETPKPQVRVGYMATVEVTVDGVVREGSAVGSGMVHPDSEADGHESAIKEAETDAMKRALRTFGNTFGLALYDKDKANREVAPPPPLEFDARREADRIKAAMGKTNALAGIENGEKAEAPILAKIREASPPMAAEVETFITQRKETLQHTGAAN